MVLAGEDATDRSCLRVVLEDTCPEMRGRLVEIADPVRLHAAPAEKLTSRVSALARKARARAARERAELACVVVHEDWDATDGPDAGHARERVQKALAAELGSAHYVLATWEIEAWLLLFPDAQRATAAKWSLPHRYLDRDTGLIADPKSMLRTHCVDGRRRYSVTDAPTVLAKAVELREIDRPRGRNRSMEHLTQEAQTCCAEHLRGARPR